jgi:hypothetical protein
VNVSITTPRYTVEFRASGARNRKWTTIITCGSAAIATQTMYDLMSTRVGDWRIILTPRPPAWNCRGPGSQDEG